MRLTAADGAAGPRSRRSSVIRGVSPLEQSLDISVRHRVPDALSRSRCLRLALSTDSLAHDLLEAGHLLRASFHSRGFVSDCESAQPRSQRD